MQGDATKAKRSRSPSESSSSSSRLHRKMKIETPPAPLDCASQVPHNMSLKKLLSSSPFGWTGGRQTG
eukprot:5714465-Amphidinium_carterae.1